MYLKQAVQQLNEQPEIQVEKISSIYESAAWGLKEQNDFYNLVLKLTTCLLPEGLLDVCQKIESELERVRLIHWGPRTIDIDILLYENLEIETDHLTIPHKYLLERPFVTIPLVEIAPCILVKGYTVSSIAKKHEKLAEKCLKITSTIENFAKKHPVK